MKTSLALAFALLFGLAASVSLTGCDQQSTMKKVDKVETPGGSTTVTTEKTIEKSGDHKTTNP